MFRCIPCLSTGGLLEDVTRHMKCMLSREDDHQAQPMQSSGSSPNSATTMLDEMAEATRRLKNKRKKKKKRKQQQQKVAMGSDGHEEGGPEEKKGGVEEEIMEEYWVSEVDRGVLITFLSLPGGGNSINKIHFRKEMFDASEAKMWWDENCDMIRNLYSIQGKHASPPQADHNVSPSISAQEGGQRQMETNSVYNSVSSTLSRPAPSGKTSPGRHPEKGTAVPAKLVEWVIEDQPGVLVTVRCLPDGSKELRRVQLSCERFGEVKARAWWEENKERLHRQYT